MHLPQVRRVRILPDAIPVFHFFAHMCIPFDAEPRDESDHRHIWFAERVALAAAHRGDDGGGGDDGGHMSLFPVIESVDADETSCPNLPIKGGTCFLVSASPYSTDWCCRVIQRQRP